MVYDNVRVNNCDYSPIFDSGNRCRHLFADSLASKLECFYSFGNSTGANYAYTYRNKYRYMIWELGDYRNVDIKAIHLGKSENPGEINSRIVGNFEIGSNPAFENKDVICYSFEKELTILHGNGGYLKPETINDSCFIASGELNEIGIANMKGETQIGISFKIFPAYSILVILKKNNTFFIIMINSFENKTIPIEALQYLKL